MCTREPRSNCSTRTARPRVSTKVNFISPRIDTANQLLLIKSPVPNADHRFRNDQLLHARVVWKQISKPMVPVTAMTRLGAQSFVFVVGQGPAGATAQQKPVKLGELIGNSYVIEEGLNPGDTVIIGRNPEPDRWHAGSPPGVTAEEALCSLIFLFAARFLPRCARC